MGISHKDGEKAVARAAAKRKAAMCLSIGSNYDLEEIAEANPGFKMLQIYPSK